MVGCQRIAMVAITRHGSAMLNTLGPLLPEAELFVAPRFADLLAGVGNRVITIDGKVGAAVGELFGSYDQLLFTFSIGAAVRLIAPHLRGKEVDPGVVVVDDSGRFVIPILSGHQGGANAFAEQLAKGLGATAVVTTASEARGTIAVDILGRELGWRVEAPKVNLLRMAAHVVNDEPVALVQEAGARSWWPTDRPLPANITCFERLEDVVVADYAGLLWITHRQVPDEMWQQLQERLVVYRPPVGQHS